MKVGLVGFAGSGRTTVFNTLTDQRKVKTLRERNGERILRGVPAFSSCVTGELLVARHDTAEARRWFSRDVAGIIGGPAVATVLWEFLGARLFDRLGDRERAAGAYQYVVDAWRHGDPAVQPWVAQARAGLARVAGTGTSYSGCRARWRRWRSPSTPGSVRISSSSRRIGRCQLGRSE